jgi:hypothetical protein
MSSFGNRCLGRRLLNVGGGGFARCFFFVGAVVMVLVGTVV